jgi:hypothetical protein
MGVVLLLARLLLQAVVVVLAIKQQLAHLAVLAEAGLVMLPALADRAFQAKEMRVEI